MFNVDNQPASTAAQLAFVILGEAYSELAQALRKIDDEPARELLKTVEVRAQLKMEMFNVGAAESSGDRELVSQAAQPVSLLLRSAHMTALPV